MPHSSCAQLPGALGALGPQFLQALLHSLEGHCKHWESTISFNSFDSHRKSMSDITIILQMTEECLKEAKKPTKVIWRAASQTPISTCSPYTKPLPPLAERA